MSLKFENIRKTFTEENGNEFVVLDDISFDVNDGEFVSIMGPSGCGKSTFLNMLAGILPVDSGEIWYQGSAVSPADLPSAYIFQESRVLNWRTVGENIKFALKAQGIPEAEHEERITSTLEMVGLENERDNYPLRLSGGMRQRVGIARALSVDPSILLMDEPFSSLDELTARQLREDVLELWQETDKTIIFVTHDVSEAVFLSDRVFFFDTRGQIFNRAEITHERPREPDDPELLETEAELMETFFDHMTAIQ
ncbi:ABC transporter ATP-binding protein [Natrarchaeobius chitinivorans]|nr:ABC transporter ATP-binding protein [Natrarchaeobius chitinivorans]